MNDWTNDRSFELQERYLALLAKQRYVKRHVFVRSIDWITLSIGVFFGANLVTVTASNASNASRLCDVGDRARGDAMVAIPKNGGWWSIDVGDLRASRIVYSKCARADVTHPERGLLGMLATSNDLADFDLLLAENAKVVASTGTPARAIYAFARSHAENQIADGRRSAARLKMVRRGLSPMEYALYRAEASVLSHLDSRLRRLTYVHLSTSVRRGVTPYVDLARTNASEASSPPCARSDTEPAIDGPAVVPNYPQRARERGARGVVVVRVLVDSAARIEAASVVTSSGNPRLDRSALDAANTTRYIPRIVNCAGYAGTYSFVADFHRGEVDVLSSK